MSGPDVLIDTNVFVSARNRSESGRAACARLLDLVDEGKVHAVVSTISLAELRAGMSPAEAKNVWQAFVSHLLASPNYEVAPVDLAVAEAAGEIRQRSRLTLPDALILATGQLRAVECVVTQDRQFGRAQTDLEVRSPDKVG